jgi:hypothetical protein
VFFVLVPGAAGAQPSLAPAAPSFGVLAPAAPSFGVLAPTAPSLATVAFVPRQESVRHWRRSDEERNEPRRSSPVQIHAGFFSQDGSAPTSFAFGFRGGPSVDEHIQLGVGLDWYHDSENQREVVGETSQNGRPVSVTRELSRASSDLVPIQAFLQLNLGSGRSLVPYAGIAGQYQVLFLTATDFQTGADYEATFGGWGWQAWGGVALPLSSHARLFGEAFVNSGEVGRDVNDPSSAVTYREIVDADGAGMRFGLSWGF